MNSSSTNQGSSTTGTMGSVAGSIGSAPPVGAPAPATPVNLGLLARVEALIGKVDTVLQSDTLKAKGYIEKYWPIVAGALIAATRLVHL